MSSTDDQGQGQDPFNDPTAPAPDAPLTPPYAGGPSAKEYLLALESRHHPNFCSP